MQRTTAVSAIRSSDPFGVIAIVSTPSTMIPGFVFTSLAAGGRTEKPAGAWTAEQTGDFMFERLEAGDFYILCPDGALASRPRGRFQGLRRE